jgi:ABC-type siderophore export system fused ATPase/permease subunit
VVSHDQHYFAAADRVISMIDGKVAVDDRPEQAPVIGPNPYLATPQAT